MVPLPPGPDDDRGGLIALNPWVWGGTFTWVLHCPYWISEINPPSVHLLLLEAEMKLCQESTLPGTPMVWRWFVSRSIG